MILSPSVSPRASRLPKGQADAESPGMPCHKATKGDLKDVFRKEQWLKDGSRVSQTHLSGKNTFLNQSL